MNIVQARHGIVTDSRPSSWFETGKFDKREQFWHDLWGWRSSGHRRGWLFDCTSPVQSYPISAILPFQCPWEFHLFKRWPFSWCQDTVFVLSTCQKLWHKTETYSTHCEHKGMCLVSSPGRIHSPGRQLLLPSTEEQNTLLFNEERAKLDFKLQILGFLTNHTFPIYIDGVFSEV